MKLRNFLIKHDYLLKLSITLILAIYIPGIFFGQAIFKRTHEEIIKKSENKYYDLTVSFSAYFNEQMDELRRHTLSIVYGNENADNDKKILRQRIESHPYYYLKATQIMADYRIGLSKHSLIGIYFDESDWVITSSHKYRIDDFTNSFSDGSTENRTKIEEFLTKSRDRVNLISNFDCKEVARASFFVGFPTLINKNEGAFIFYNMKYDSINTGFFEKMGKGDYEKLKLLVFEKNGDLFYTNGVTDYDTYQDIIGGDQFKDFLLSDTNEMSNIISLNNYMAMKVYNGNLKKYFVSLVPSNLLQSGFDQYYSLVFKMTTLGVLSFAFLLMLSIYINYRPILNLVKSIRIKNQINMESEIKTISAAMSRMEEDVAEQRIILMDYMLSNILYGIPIEQNVPERLGMGQNGEKYCVFAAEDLNMNTNERNHLTFHIYEGYSTHVFITDLLYKNHMIMICVIERDNIGDILEGTKKYLNKKYSREFKIGVGYVVEDINDIRKSYLNALRAMELISVNTGLPHPEITFMENYPEEDINLFLQNVENGEKDNALRLVDSLFKYIDSLETFLLKQYVACDLLISYIRCLQKIKYPIDTKDQAVLLNNNNPQELLEALRFSVMTVCDVIKHNNQLYYDNLQKQIFEYVNNNFADYNLCRTQVADEFNISIYTLSRFFKETAGIGFKEYILSKRLEFSKALLISTNKTIAEITSEVGFADPGYFSRIFKMTYGLTPSKFRMGNGL